MGFLEGKVFFVVIVSILLLEESDGIGRFLLGDSLDFPSRIVGKNRRDFHSRLFQDNQAMLSDLRLRVFLSQFEDLEFQITIGNCDFRSHLIHVVKLDPTSSVVIPPQKSSIPSL